MREQARTRPSTFLTAASSTFASPAISPPKPQLSQGHDIPPLSISGKSTISS